MAEASNEPRTNFSVQRSVRILPVVASDELPAGSKCMFCQNPYNTVIDGKAEYAIRLDCQHIVGSNCMSKWLQEMRKSSCPYCRKELFGLHEGNDRHVNILFGLDFEASKTLYARELELYGQLLRVGAQLPPLEIAEETFSTVCKDAFFKEMRRRGAFGALEDETSWADMDSYLWDLARWNGLVWQPGMLWDGVTIENAWWAGEGPVVVFYKRK